MDTKGSKILQRQKKKDKKDKKKENDKENDEKSKKKQKQKSPGRKAVRWEDLEQQADFLANTLQTLCQGALFPELVSL